MEFKKSSLSRVMGFEKTTYVGNLGFEKMILVGNLSWAVSTWEKTGQKPITDPPGERSPGGGRLFLSTQKSSIRERLD